MSRPILRIRIYHANNSSNRENFTELNLVFDTQGNTWLSPELCIWADERVQFPGKASISAQYPSLKDFFLRILQVPEPDVGMHVQALLRLSQEHPTSLQLKQAIKHISLFHPKPTDVNDLRMAHIFPVILPNGQIKITTRSADFAIIDREEFGEAFRGQIVTLDFTLEEVRECQEFITACGMDKKRLSRKVEERTDVNGGSLASRLTEEFQNKAFAIFRYVD